MIIFCCMVALRRHLLRYQRRLCPLLIMSSCGPRSMLIICTYLQHQFIFSPSYRRSPLHPPSVSIVHRPRQQVPTGRSVVACGDGRRLERSLGTRGKVGRRAGLGSLTGGGCARGCTSTSEEDATGLGPGELLGRQARPIDQ